eukprot:PhF_6_TR40411/c0_g1_i2/m.60229
MVFFSILVFIFVSPIRSQSLAPTPTLNTVGTNCPYKLPCLPCYHNASCSTTQLYTHTDGQVFGTCNCSGTGYVGVQCELLSSAVCVNPCQHSGVCIGGQCQCVAPYIGGDCSTPTCTHLRDTNSYAVPTIHGDCPPCREGYGGAFCRLVNSSKGCPAGQHYANTLHTPETDTEYSCSSNDAGFSTLLAGRPTIFTRCSKPSTWDDNITKDGTCSFEFYRNDSFDNLFEELFSCNFTQCVAERKKKVTTRTTSDIVSLNALLVSEPDGAGALRYLLFIFSVLFAFWTVIGKAESNKHNTILTVFLVIVVVLIILNGTVGAKLYSDENSRNIIPSEKVIPGDTTLSITCLKTKCSCAKNV